MPTLEPIIRPAHPDDSQACFVVLDPFVTYLMANRSFGKFDRFIGFSPPFVL